MALDWDIMLGRRKVPEGFPTALYQSLSTAGPLGTFSFKLDEAYWFYLEAVIAKWAEPTAAASIPSLEIFRESANRNYIPTPVDLRLISSPGWAYSGKAALGRVVGLGIYYSPGAAVQMRVTGHVGGDPASIKLVAFGRYVLEPEDG